MFYETNMTNDSHGLKKDKLTTISVTRDTYLKLKALGQTADSFNDVLSRVLDLVGALDESGAKRTSEPKPDG
jgi:hypothetical protein